MKYALGNMLNGAGGLNPDGLALDLQFAADKTLTARRGPTPVFTRASSGTFVGSNGLIQSAGNNVARFDHDPVTLASRGLLIEESRTNLILQSENFGNTWSSVNLNLTGTPPYLNVATAPDGETTADKLIATTSNATHQFRQDVTLVSGTAYTISVYFKAAETNFALISIVGVANGNADWVAYFNISASSPAAGQFNGFASTSLVDVGNGWRRCSVTFTATASGSLNTRFGGATSANLNSNFYAGDGTSGFLLWGAQLEAGSFATSYIPTTTASVVRSADVCSISGAAFSEMWNASEGTIYAAHYQYGATGFGAILTADNTSDVGKVQIARLATTQGYLSIKDNSNNEVFAYLPTSSLVAGRNKSALAYKQNDTIATINNLSSPLDTTVLLGTQNQLLIGNDSVGSGRRHNGAIDSIRVYKKRLSLAKLQALTAP